MTAYSSETECIITDVVRNPSSEADARVIRTRAALREALVALLAEQPFAALTVREIAARAGVGYATFFRRYKDKEELLFEINEDLMSEVLARLLPGMGRGDTGLTARELCRFVRENEALCRAVLAGGGEDSVRSEAVRRAVARIVALRPREGGDIATELAIFHSVSATLNLLGWWLRAHAELDVDAMASAIEALVLNPTVRWRNAAPAAR